jgi:diacylglycerol kinase (ATP)
VADIGIGAAVVQELEHSSRRFGANLSYLRAIFSAFLKYRKPLLSVESDEGLDWLRPSLAVIAGNGRCFGSGLFATPQAALDDGLLDITLIGDVSVVDFIRKLPALKGAELISHPQVFYHRARHATISSGDTAGAVEADGEYLGRTPATLEILPAAMHFLLPANGRALPRESAGQAANCPR